MYPDKIKLVYKNFPLDDDGPSMLAALAATAAHQQGRFCEFHHSLFKTPDQIDSTSIMEIAVELMLDPIRFKGDLEAPETLARVKSDLRIGDEAGVDRVPSVFVNGKLVKGGSLYHFLDLVERELEKMAEKDSASGS